MPPNKIEIWGNRSSLPDHDQCVPKSTAPCILWKRKTLSDFLLVCCCVFWADAKIIPLKLCIKVGARRTHACKKSMKKPPLTKN